METSGQSSDPRIPLAMERTSLAKYRTQLALDRTTLAWLRTALTFATFGFGMVAFFRVLKETNNTPEAARLHQGALHMGVGLIVLGIAAVLLTGVAHLSALRRLRRGEIFPLTQWPLTVTVAALVCILGLYGLWVVLFG